MVGQVFPPMGKVWSTQNTDNVMHSAGRGRPKSGEEFLCLDLSCLALKSEFYLTPGSPEHMRSHRQSPACVGRHAETQEKAHSASALTKREVHLGTKSLLT